jgi:hypothetical protein
VLFKDGQPLIKWGDNSLTPNFIKGSTRADFVTTNIVNLQNAQNFSNPREHYNLKFGERDVLQVEYSQHLKNLPAGTDFYQVKPNQLMPKKVEDVLNKK